MNHSLWWLVTVGAALGLVSMAQAGRVRNLYSNDQVMQEVNLTMGRSTVLRFDEKPTTSVLGNQNYFNLEYIGNDITIQPQGVVSTNLFVYTESQTYGLILKVGPESIYDDLVSVKWRPGYVNVSDQRKKKIEIVQEVDLNKRLEIKGAISVNIKKLTRSIAQGLLIVDMEIQNLGKVPVKSSELRFVLSGSNKKAISILTTAAKLDVIPAGEKTEIRLVARAPLNQPVQIAIHFGNKVMRTALSPGRSP